MFVPNMGSGPATYLTDRAYAQLFAGVQVFKSPKLVFLRQLICTWA